MVSKVLMSMVDGLVSALGGKADTSALSNKADTSVTNGLNTRVAALEAALPRFTKEYVSGELTITAGGTGTLTHGLGVAPKTVDAYLVCKTAEQNYAVGDVVKVGTWSQGGADKGVSLIIPKEAQRQSSTGILAPLPCSALWTSPLARFRASPIPIGA